MSLPAVTLTQNVNHAKTGPKSKHLQNIIQQKKQKPKKIKITFSDDESDHELPIPLIPRESDSLSSDEGEDLNKENEKLTEKRRPIPRHISKSMKTAKKSPKIDALKTIPKYNPRPPNCPKSPIQLDKITPKNGELKNEESKNEEFNNLYNSDNNSSKNKSILDQNENGTSVSQAKKKIIRNRSNNNVASLLKDIDVSKLPKKRFTFMKQILSTFNKNKFSLTMSREEGEPFSTIVDLREQTLEFTHESNYIITLNKEKNEFILKKNNSKCDDLCSIKYQIEKEPVKHKKCMITFLFDIIGISSPLQNIPPKIKDGKICLDFNDENVIPSVKNMIFQDSCQNELITIVRTSKTTLSITSIPIIPDEIIFFIGFSSFADHTS